MGSEKTHRVVVVVVVVVVVIYLSIIAPSTAQGHLRASYLFQNHTGLCTNLSLKSKQRLSGQHIYKTKNRIKLLK